MASTDDPCQKACGARGTVGLRRTVDLAECAGDVGIDWVSRFGRCLVSARLAGRDDLFGAVCFSQSE